MITMNNLSRIVGRREFMGHVGKLGVASAASAFVAPAAVARGANERLSVGLIGCGNQGRALAQFFSALPDVNLVYVCDPDSARREKVKQEVGADRAVSDLRHVLDDNGVDAVVIATPDHWHVPAAILACEADKHVYVEKPCSQNYRESRMLLDAVRRNDRVFQHGTNQRSSPLVTSAIQMLRDGKIGEVLSAKAWNIQRRDTIGRESPCDPPPGVDYDLWLGPAEVMPFQANRFHYNWRWWHNFGTGDVGNDGMHELDYARWGLGVDSLPSGIAGIGGKYFFDDDQQFPDTATITFEYPGAGSGGRHKQLIFEMRLWSTNYPYNCDSGVEFYGTKGQLFVSKRGKIQLRDERNQRVQVEQEPHVPDLANSHQADFVDAIKTGRKPRAHIEEAHRSVALVHLGNIAVRLGRSLKFDPQQEQIVGDVNAGELLGRTYRTGGHWAIPKEVV
jgi:predicted dehydrogenase